MKTRQLGVILFAIWLSLHGVANDKINFDYYKKLSNEDRSIIVDKASPEMQKKFKQWNQILSMGGQWWGPFQAEAFIRSKGFSGLENIVNLQINLWGNYHIEIVQAKLKAGLSEEEARKFADTVSNYTDNDKERYKDIWWYLVKLAPTPEALALNAKASTLAAEFDKRYNGSRGLTIDDLKVVDIEVKNLREQMRKLPQLTPDQIEAGFAELPQEDIHH